MNIVGCGERNIETLTLMFPANQTSIIVRPEVQFRQSIAAICEDVVDAFQTDIIEIKIHPRLKPTFEPQPIFETQRDAADETFVERFDIGHKQTTFALGSTPSPFGDHASQRP